MAVLEQFRKFITPQLASTLAVRLGESDENVREGFGFISAAMVHALASKLTDPLFAAEMFTLLSSARGDLITDLVSLAKGEPVDGRLSTAVETFVNRTFGSKEEVVFGSVAQAAGLGPGSPPSLARIAAPIIMAFLGQRIREVAHTPSSLAALLQAEELQARAALPGGSPDLLNGETKEPPAGPLGRIRSWLWTAASVFV